MIRVENLNLSYGDKGVLRDFSLDLPEEGITALHNAICGANYPIVDFLIAAGANVNSPDSHGW